MSANQSNSLSYIPSTPTCRKRTGSCPLASNFTTNTMYMGLKASATMPSNLELFLSPFRVLGLQVCAIKVGQRF